MRAVLNVGGGTKAIAIPAHFDGWRHDLLDIDPTGNPDVLTRRVFRSSRCRRL